MVSIDVAILLAIAGFAIGLAFGASGMRGIWREEQERATTSLERVARSLPMQRDAMAHAIADAILAASRKPEEHDGEGADVVAGARAIELYGKQRYDDGVSDLRTALVHASGLPPEVADYAATLAIAALPTGEERHA